VISITAHSRFLVSPSFKLRMRNAYHAIAEKKAHVHAGPAEYAYTIGPSPNPPPCQPSSESNSRTHSCHSKEQKHGIACYIPQLLAAPCCTRLLPKLPSVGENILSATGWNTLCVTAAALRSSAGADGGSSRSQMGTYGLSACWPLLRLLAAAERGPVLSALPAASAADAPGLGRASRLLNLVCGQ
jgi:hypothetical protein